MDQYQREHAAAERGYPSPEGVARNPMYAKMLLDDYAGPMSETTAILTYMYQHYVTGANCRNISKTLERIAITEMRHHELLGKTIVALGGNPVLADSRCRFFSTREIDYTPNPMKMLRQNIEAERQAISGYERSIRAIGDRRVQEILYRIVEDEEVHLELFHELIRELNTNGCRG